MPYRELLLSVMLIVVVCLMSVAILRLIRTLKDPRGLSTSSNWLELIAFLIILAGQFILYRTRQ